MFIGINTVKKREYYKMDITSIQDADTNNIEIIFRKDPFSQFKIGNCYFLFS